MFTGIVEEVGIWEEVKELPNLLSVVIRTRKVAEGTKAGDSVAVNGVCLTVTEVQGKKLHFDMMKETIHKTSLRGLVIGGQVNLERALKMNDRLGGHFVSGHVDGVVGVWDIKDIDHDTDFKIELPQEFRAHIVEKGSVCLDGVSLTIGKVFDDHFHIYLIPFTKQVTTLGTIKAGDVLNIETDILAKYVLNKDQ